MKTIILRNNRWRCDHGWDIDLDDGSSNYEITNNLCLNGGIKNREGFYRTVENNILVNNSFCPHVWYADSQDIFRHNIIWGDYRPAHMKMQPWGQEMDNNLVQALGKADAEPATSLQKQSGRDEHSIIADAQFIDPARGDYRVKEGSPALGLGFVNFPMDQFGVQKPELKALARTPEFPDPNSKKSSLARDATMQHWCGTDIRNIRDEGEMSVYGLPGVIGVLVLAVDPSSDLAKAGLKPNDVILGWNEAPINSVDDLLKPENAPIAGKSFKIKISSNQFESTLISNP